MPTASRETQPIVTQSDLHVDVGLAALAAAQHGVVSLAQLRAVGLSGPAARKRAARGRLHRIHRGVYAVGHRRISVKGRLAAAVLACGEGATSSHRSAAYLLGLVRGVAAFVEVTVPVQDGRRGHTQVVVHRSSTLSADDVTLVEGIPCTTVARTLLDLADVLPERRLMAAIDSAERLRLYDDRQVKAVLARGGGRRAAKRLRRALGTYEEPDATRSELERRALALFAASDLPPPRVNSYVETAAGPIQVDFFWPDRGLVVEADSYLWHSARRDFENDRERDQLLHAAGFSVVRVTWRQVLAGSERTLRALASARRAH